MDIYDTRVPHSKVADGSQLAEIFHPLRLNRDISARYSIAHARVEPGEKTLPHRLIQSSEAYYILSGKGMMHIGDETEEVYDGQLVYIPPGKTQWIENTGSEDLLFLAICDPLWREEDEIIGRKNISEPDRNDPFMQAAIREAELGRDEGGIPIGSVLVKNGEIIGRGHNRRVQDVDPVVHAEIDCIRNAGRIGSFKDCILYSTLMPCYLCAGAVVQFNIPQVIVGESRTFPGAREFMEAHGVKVLDLDLLECVQMMEAFIRKCPELWNEDIGVL